MNTQDTILEIQRTFDINAIYAQKILGLIRTKNILKEAAEIIEEKPKPFVKWVGGKRQLLKQFRLMNLYPPHEFNSEKNSYFEPFVGGGAMFFDLLPEKSFLSDLNADLVVTYNVIKNNIEDIIQALKKHEYDKEYFLKIRAKNPINDIDIASRFIYLNRTCFNGMYRVNSKGQFNVPFGKYSNPLICDEQNLRRVSKSLKDVEIKHQDYKEILKETKNSDFIYFDPPYYPVNKTSSFTSYTSESFLEKEQTELRDTFVELHKRGCFVMLSNSDTQFINKIYSRIKGVRITKVQAGRAINSNAFKRGKITEVLVTNY